MIITFIKKLDLQDGFHPEFFFNRIYTAAGIRFHVSVIDGAGKLSQFIMADQHRAWKIVSDPLPPDWIVALEAKLSQVICENMLS